MIKYFYFKHNEHPLTSSSKELKNLPENIINILKEWKVEFSDKVIVAYDNNNIVGFFRYDLGKTKPWLYAAGTYVNPEYRNKNIAYTLWNNIILKENPKKILAHVASDGGLNLLKRIQNSFPKIIFDYSLDEKIKAA